MKHLKISVRGRVQGVSFRNSTKQKAMELGISGFARNEPDGTVYIEAEGEAGALDAFVRWCHEGPNEAIVESVSKVESEMIGHTEFRTY